MHQRNGGWLPDTYVSSATPETGASYVSYRSTGDRLAVANPSPGGKCSYLVGPSRHRLGLELPTAGVTAGTVYEQFPHTSSEGYPTVVSSRLGRSPHRAWEMTQGMRVSSSAHELLDEDDSVPHVRLSRHIPQREGMDMAVASFNLIGPSVVAPPLHTGGMRANGAPGSTSRGTPGSPLFAVGGSSGYAAVAANSFSTQPASSSAFTSFSESQISDDSSHMTSLYNDMLAEKLIRPESTRSNDGLVTGPGGAVIGVGASNNDGDRGSINGAQRHGIGGEVFCFSGTESSLLSAGASGGVLRERRNFSAYPCDINSPLVSRSMHGQGVSFSRSRHAYNSSRSARTQRVLHTNPERVLDAPGFPPNASQLIHWGSNNKLIIGLKYSLYLWDATTGQPGKLLELKDDLSICCVHWVHKCSCVALGVGGGTTAIYDCRSEDFLRTLRLPTGLEVTGMAVNGPLLAVASNASRGCTHVFDLRAKNAVVAMCEGHHSTVTSLQYCTSEPYYLATGGADGSVRVWDARRSSSPRYAFDSVHNGSITCVHWNPEKRSRLFTGGQDGVLCYGDTHAQVRTVDENGMDEEGGACEAARGSQFVVRAVQTMYPITGLVTPAGAGEVLTSHGVKGQLQLRNTANFHLLGVFTSPNCDAGISCVTLGQDKECVCAAQADETLKFWRVFDSSAFHTNERKGGLLYQDPLSLLDEQLR